MAWRFLDSQLICDTDKPRNYVDCTKVISHLFDDTSLDDPKDRDDMIAKLEEWDKFITILYRYSEHLEKYIGELRANFKECFNKSISCR